MSATTLWLAEQPGTRLVVYTAADQETKDAMALLRETEPWLPWTEASR
jgi:hypothetical protein